MPKTYRVNRPINWVFRTLTRLGLGASYRHILTVRGRKTGREYSTPVDVMQVGGQRWLVAGYGPVNWTKNVRASSAATLSRGGRSKRYRAEEAGPPQALPVLRTYMAEVPVTRPYFHAGPDSPDEVVAAEIARHPVFRLTPATAEPTRGQHPSHHDDHTPSGPPPLSDSRRMRLSDLDWPALAAELPSMSHRTGHEAKAGNIVVIRRGGRRDGERIGGDRCWCGHQLTNWPETARPITKWDFVPGRGLSVRHADSGRLAGPKAGRNGCSACEGVFEFQVVGI
jgi:deazaflavin-dependent oxidoreductase (nitroreductase family)